MNKHDEYRANDYERASALAAFSQYTYIGALYILRVSPDAAETAIRTIAATGVESLERYLEEVA